MSTYKLAAGGVTLPLTIMPAGRSGSLDLGEQERPRGDGSTWQTGRQKARVYRLAGAIAAATPDALDTLVRQVRTAMDGGILQFFAGRDDRYFNVQCESWSDDYQGGLLYGLHVECAMQLKAADVFGYATAPTTAALTVGASTTVTNAGDVYSNPAWSITIGTAGTGVITLSNTTTGEMMTISGTFAAGDIVVLDRSTYIVTQNAVAQFGLIDGRIPRLLAGANTIPALGVAGGISVSAASVTYTERFQ